MTFAVAETFSFGNAPVFLFVDHASNAVPAEFNNLGLDAQTLTRHIGWDIGAEAVALNVGEQLRARVLCCRFSRLLIDPNRSLDNPALVPEVSDDVLIPANQSLSRAAHQSRIDTYYQPYHDQLAVALDEMKRLHSDPLIISVHSFTPRLSARDDARPWHISLLWKDDEKTAQEIMKNLRAETEFVIGDNVPYSGQIYNATVDKHVGPRKLKHATFELRQDLISEEQGVVEMSAALTNAIAQIL